MSASSPRPIFRVTDHTLTALRKGLAEKKAALEAAVITRLEYIGEAAVKQARDAGSYTDRTGNLRSSIGYVLLYNGAPIRWGTPQTYKEGNAGPAASKALLTTLAGKYSRGYTLIVCAGMNYAAYVENIHHRDVLSSAETVARKLAEHLREDIAAGLKSTNGQQ